MLESECADGEAAFYASHLPQPPERIIQAMKLFLAHYIQNHSLTDETRNVFSTGASMLPRFIDDNEAQRLNEIRRRFKLLPRDERMKQYKMIREVDNWQEKAFRAGSILVDEMSKFIETVEQFDTI